MRIAQIITGLAPAGAERVVCELSKALAARGHAVAVFCLQDPPANRTVCDELESAGIPFHPLGVAKARPWAALGLRRMLERFRPDAVHAHLIHANLASRVASLRPRPWRLVNTVHIAERRPGKWWHFLLDRLTLGLCDSQTAVSRAVRAFHAPRIGQAPEAMPVILNGLRPPRPLASAEREEARAAWGFQGCSGVVGSVGRLDWQKGYDLLLSLLPELAARSPEGWRWGLVILGEGPERARLEALAAAAPPAVAARLPGFRSDAARLAGAFDVFAMPSRYEGYGLTLAEAMAHGVPCLCSPVDSLPELLEGYPNGALVDFHGKEAAADAIVRMARRQERTPRPPRTPEAMADEYLALYA